MIPQQTFESYPVFGDNATKIKPDNAKYAAGFQQSDVLPAEWMNWAWSKNTKGITDLNRGMTSVETEILNVLTAGGQTPAEETGNQLLQSIKYLIGQAETRAKLAAHPVGSLYWSGDPTDPGQLFGGTWAPVKDCFVWAKGDNDTANAIGQNAIEGGSKTHTITSNELPQHTHAIGGSTGGAKANVTVDTKTGKVGLDDGKVDRSGFVNVNQDGSWAPDNGSLDDLTYATGGSLIFDHNHSITQTNHSHTLPANTGNNTTDNAEMSIMPPYIIKYCWERTA